MSEKIKLTVDMEVTVPQALALKAMFEYWNQCGSWGMSREVGFYVDGDGNFNPRCNIATSKELPELTDEFKQVAIIRDYNGDRLYDFDAIAYLLNPNK